ncbi:MAG: GW dipeptide domain-containing protein [Motiliproteus sp.]
MLIKKPLSIVILSLSSIWLSGCSDDSEKTAKSPEKTNAPAAQVQAKQHAANEGLVLDTLSSGGYTYVEVEQNGNKLWLAGSGSNINKGEVISWGQAALMQNFTSKTLNRTFDKIYFVSSFIGKSAAPVHSGINLSQPAPAPVSAPQDMGRVLSHTSAGGYTYVQAETPTGETWIAAPMFSIKDGDLVRWTGASKMTNFTSKTLNKTFAEILFVARAQVVDAKQAPAVTASSANVNQGEVVATEESGGYTYMQVNTQAGEKWLAVPTTAVKVGDTVSWNGASAMHNFTSKTLNKTFEEILFAGGITVK